MKTKWDSYDYTFSDILRCGKCNRAISPFKSKNWVYLKCANSKCDNPNTAESLVLGSIEAMLKNITIPSNMVDKVVSELKSKHDDQQKYYTQALESVRREHDDIDRKLALWFERLVNDRVSPEQHDMIVASLKDKQAELNDTLNTLTNTNANFQVNASYLIDLASRAAHLFKQGSNAQRSKLLGFIVSNLKLNDKKLTFTVNYPLTRYLKKKKKALRSLIGIFGAGTGTLTLDLFLGKEAL